MDAGTGRLLVAFVWLCLWLVRGDEEFPDAALGGESVQECVALAVVFEEFADYGQAEESGDDAVGELVDGHAAPEGLWEQSADGVFDQCRPGLHPLGDLSAKFAVHQPTGDHLAEEAYVAGFAVLAVQAPRETPELAAIGDRVEFVAVALEAGLD